VIAGSFLNSRYKGLHISAITNTMGRLGCMQLLNLGGLDMAGSLKWVVYTDDFGTAYALFADESNTEAVNTGGDYTGTPALVDALPRNVRPRYGVYGNADGSRIIRCPILTPADYLALPASHPTIPDPITPATTLTLQRLRPEIRRLPVPNDTGLQDGDAT